MLVLFRIFKNCFSFYLRVFLAKLIMVWATDRIRDGTTSAVANFWISPNHRLVEVLNYRWAQSRTSNWYVQFHFRTKSIWTKTIIPFFMLYFIDTILLIQHGVTTVGHLVVWNVPLSVSPLTVISWVSNGNFIISHVRLDIYIYQCAFVCFFFVFRLSLVCRASVKLDQFRRYRRDINLLDAATTITGQLWLQHTACSTLVHWCGSTTSSDCNF